METTIQLDATPAVLLSYAMQGRRQNSREIVLTCRSIKSDSLKESFHWKTFINYFYMTQIIQEFT